MKKATSYLYNELTPIFKLQYLTNDIFAAISIVFVGIPLSLAVAIASGVGPSVGLISAIIGGIFGALLGGTRLAVTGPAVAMSVLIANSIQLYGFSSIYVIGIICGILQLIFGIFRLGRFAKLVPLSLVLAFTAGIGFLIFFAQLPHVFSISKIQSNTNPLLDFINHTSFYINNVNFIECTLVILTILILKLLPKLLPKAPPFLFAVAIPTLVVYFGNFKYINLVGNIPHNLLHTGNLDFSQIHDWPRLLITSCEVFLLASLETLLSSSAIDLMGTGDLHNPNQELIGQGVANIGVALFGGIPVTGLIARSSVNVIAGGKTRRAAILQALIILLVVYLCPEIIEIIPIAVLVGILIAASITMMNFKQVYDLWKTNRAEFAIYLITFLAIVTTDLIDGIQIGLFTAFIIMGFRMLNTKTNIKLWANKNVLRVGLTGNITFWSYEKLSKIEQFAIDQEEIKFVIFEFGKLQNIDTTGASHLIKISEELNKNNIKTIFHNLTDDQQSIVQSLRPENSPFIITLTENEIKTTLEAHGVTHSASDVLKHGIVKFMNEYAKENTKLISTLAMGQKPHTLLITCSDSRLDPNAFFGSSIGELFIVRNVGNVVPPYNEQNIYSEVAAIEFAINELGIRNIVLCAHTECGAVKASIPMTELPYVGLNSWLELIRNGFRENKPLTVDMGVKINLLHQVKNLKTYSSVAKLLETKELTINTWIYDVHSGHMLEWDESKKDFVNLV